MNIYNRSTLLSFVKKHADSREQLMLWYNEISGKRWKTPKDIKKGFVSASIIANNRVVFNIKGNKYRLVVAMDYERQYALIKFIGTHAEYDKIDANTVEKF